MNDYRSGLDNVAAVAIHRSSFITYHLEYGCQRFTEPVLSPLLYKITTYLQEVIEGQI
jgi:hypothetical protein